MIAINFHTAMLQYICHGGNCAAVKILTNQRGHKHMHSSKQVTSFYALIQSLYWMTYGLMFNFASAYLLECGFSNGQIGVVLGISYALSACLQAPLASLFNRGGLRLSSCMACVYIVIAVLSALVLALPVEGLALCVLIVCIFMLQSSMQPSVNSLHRGYELSGISVNFGFARGVGSAAFSLLCALVGQLLKRMSPRMLPALYLCTVVLLVICLIFFRSPSFAGNNPRRRQEKRAPLLRRHPRFALFLLGVGCLSMVHIFIDNFMLQIMQSLGGSSTHQGTAIALAAVTELPAMVIYTWLSKKTDGRNLLRFAMWMWAAKHLLILLATNPTTIYISELLQFISYAFYVPATVDYISRSLPQEDFLKGQAFSGTAFTLGSLAATFIGGWLLDAVGTHSALMILQLPSIAGAALITIAIPHVPRTAERHSCA